jgi:methyl-accepting chemotaxis protein
MWAPGVRLFRSLRFTAKALIISFALVVPLLVLLNWQMIRQSDDAYQTRMASTRAHVQIAYGVLGWAQQRESAGQLSREQAQQLARDAIANLRYDGTEYFWITDMQPRMLMHPVKPALDGTDVSEIKDPNGVPLFTKMAEQVKRQGEGFVTYQWPKPGSAQPVDKISYVKGFAPWGWVIGSGIYVGDIREALLRQLALGATVIVCTLLVAGYLFLSFYKVMDGGLKETGRHLKAMTAGDLTTSPSPWGRDEAAHLMNELKAMQDSLRTMVARVRRSSDDIDRSSSTIADGAQDLARRTELAAASLEESAASMEQIGATVKNTADNTRTGAQIAQQSSETAASGGRVMRDVVATMQNIRASSAKISEHLGVIDSIAFQTNILALNAAVEAARAGEHGRGFAVVASEVRMLAHQSATAAKEISGLIKQSVAEINGGTEIVQQAASTMDDIVQTSRRVDQLLGDIASASQEQTVGIGQIGQAIQELDRTTQQNSALVDQTAAAATTMRQQAEGLAQEVARFKLPAHNPR